MYVYTCAHAGKLYSSRQMSDVQYIMHTIGYIGLARLGQFKAESDSVKGSDGRGPKISVCHSFCLHSCGYKEPPEAGDLSLTIKFII